MDHGTGDRPDVVVVGGGLAGLIAAVSAARSGASVQLFEARSARGGRARTEFADGFARNQGPHALYRAGAGMAVLREYGVAVKGRVPHQRGAQWLRDGSAVPLARPSAIGGIRGLATGLRMLSRRAANDARGMTLDEWLDAHVPVPARPFAEMLVRTTGYALDPACQDAGASLDQVRRGARGVLYLDGGWSTLVDGLAAAARDSGVRMTAGRVSGVVVDDGVTVTLENGPPVKARAVVLAAGGAKHADGLLGGASQRISACAADARPVMAACLDVSLRHKPRKQPLAAYGLGEPTYVVDHAASARLAPEGGALVHCLWYEPDLRPEVDPRSELEARLDVLQPGWRDEVVDARFSQRLVVAHDRARPLVPADRLPKVDPGDLPGLYAAGDWITTDGMLADAALASGREAGHLAAQWAIRGRAVAVAHSVGR